MESKRFITIKFGNYKSNIIQNDLFRVTIEKEDINDFLRSISILTIKSVR